MKTITTPTTFLRLTDDLLLYSVLLAPDTTPVHQDENTAAVLDLTEQQPFRLILDLRPVEHLTSSALRQYLRTYATDQVLAVAVILTPDMQLTLDLTHTVSYQRDVPLRMFEQIPEAVPWLKTIECAGCVAS